MTAQNRSGSNAASRPRVTSSFGIRIDNANKPRGCSYRWCSLAAPMSLQYHRDVQIGLQAAEPNKCSPDSAPIRERIQASCNNSKGCTCHQQTRLFGRSARVPVAVRQQAAMQPRQLPAWVDMQSRYLGLYLSTCLSTNVTFGSARSCSGTRSENGPTICWTTGGRETVIARFRLSADLGCAAVRAASELCVGLHQPVR
jgi:hypothetical protein